jgi:hypothetical protein
MIGNIFPALPVTWRYATTGETGAGTAYPVGMTWDDAVELYWKCARASVSCSVTVGIDGDPYSETVSVNTDDSDSATVNFPYAMWNRSNGYTHIDGGDALAVEPWLAMESVWQPGYDVSGSTRRMRNSPRLAYRHVTGTDPDNIELLGPYDALQFAAGCFGRWDAWWGSYRGDRPEFVDIGGLDYRMLRIGEAWYPRIEIFAAATTAPVELDDVLYVVSAGITSYNDYSATQIATASFFGHSVPMYAEDPGTSPGHVTSASITVSVHTPFDWEI